MKITVDQSVIDKSIKVVEGYTAKEGTTGSAKHQQFILIKADKDAQTLTLTAENERAATEFTLTKGVKVEESGVILVPGARLKIAVSNIPSGEEVTIESEDLELHIRSGRRKLSLSTLDHTSSLLPEVGDAGKSVATFKGSSLVTGFRSGAAVFDNTESNVASNVFFRVEGNKAIFASRTRTGVNYRVVKPEKSEEKVEALVNRNLFASAIEQIDAEDTVDVSISGSDLHLIVKGERVERHISLGMSAHEVAKFNFENTFQTLKSVNRANTIFVVNRKDLIATFRSADNIAALNGKTEVRDIKVSVKKDGITISVNDRSGFEDTIDVKSVIGDNAELLFRWNQFTALFDSYPTERDEIIIGLVPSSDGSIQSLVLIADESYSQGDDASGLEYIAMAAASKG